jgi:hypothetical protein
MEGDVNIGCGKAMTRAMPVALAGVLLALALATPALGGGPSCSLQATVGGGSATEVEVGEEVLIEGFGFPATVDVALAYEVDGSPIGGETVTTDAGGQFETTVTPAAGEEGTWTVTATVTKGCTADTGFLVVAGATPVPSPTATPAPTVAPSPAGELPNVATSPPTEPDPAVLGGLTLLAGAVWLTGRRLARLVR